jgi:hypothetical protein
VQTLSVAAIDIYTPAPGEETTPITFTTNPPFQPSRKLPYRADTSSLRHYPSIHISPRRKRKAAMSTPALLALAEALKNTATEIQSIGAKLHTLADTLEKEADVFLPFALFSCPPFPPPAPSFPISLSPHPFLPPRKLTQNRTTEHSTYHRTTHCPAIRRDRCPRCGREEACTGAHTV